MQESKKEIIIGISTVISTILVTILSLGMVKAVVNKSYGAEAIMVAVSAALLVGYYAVLFGLDKKTQSAEASAKSKAEAGDEYDALVQSKLEYMSL